MRPISDDIGSIIPKSKPTYAKAMQTRDDGRLKLMAKPSHAEMVTIGKEDRDNIVKIVVGAKTI